MSDTYTEETSRNWFQRIGSAFKGILFGLLIFIAAFPVLFLNEQSEVKRFKALKEGVGSVVSVEAEKVDPANEGKLVHISGVTETKDILSDPEFAISEVALHLNRRVEMYQWKEKKSSKTEKQVGGGTKTITTYSYFKGWSSSVVNSSSFKKSMGHQNPGSMPYQQKSWSAQTVHVGAFLLNQNQISRAGISQPLTLSAVSNPAPVVRQGNAKVIDNTFYFGNDPAHPTVGDVRVSFTVSPAGGAVSIVAQQSGSSFVPYLSKTVKGQKINLLKNRTMTAEEMFEAAKNERKTLTWILRLVGLVMMVVGLMMILKPLSTVLDVIPILGNIGEGISGIVALIAGLALTLITVSISWVVNRPSVGIPVLLIGVGSLIAANRLKPSKAKKI